MFVLHLSSYRGGSLTEWSGRWTWNLMTPSWSPAMTSSWRFPDGLWLNYSADLSPVGVLNLFSSCVVFFVCCSVTLCKVGPHQSMTVNCWFTHIKYLFMLSPLLVSREQYIILSIGRKTSYVRQEFSGNATQGMFSNFSRAVSDQRFSRRVHVCSCPLTEIVFRRLPYVTTGRPYRSVREHQYCRTESCFWPNHLCSSRMYS